MSPSRRNVLQISAAAGIAALSGCVSKKDLKTLNWQDIRRNMPSRRCTFGCPGIELLDDPGAYTLLNPTKHPTNPVIHSTSVSNVQAYPASIIRVDGIFYAMVGSWPQTVGLKSSDGSEWEEVNSNVVPLGESGAFDSYKATPHVFRYDPDEEIYHLFYKGFKPENKMHSYGHATSDQPLQNYQKDQDNPVLSPETPTEFERVSDINRLYISDTIVEDGTAMFFGSGTEAGTELTFIWMGTEKIGSNIEIVPKTILFTSEDDELAVRSDPNPVGSPNVGFPSVIKIDQTYIMAYASLVRIEENGMSRGKIYTAVGNSPSEISPTNDLLLDTGECNTWEELRVYNSRWVKQQDGTYADPDLVDGNVRLTYSGHDCGESKFFGNRGVTGVVDFDPADMEAFIQQVTE